MAAELPRPGVEVIQKFRTVSPTVVTPTLVPCVVGVCKQVVDVLVPAASGGVQLNTNALVVLPAFFVATPAPGTPAAYAGLDGLPLVLSITNGPDVTVTFVGAAISPVSATAQISAAFLAAGVTEAAVQLTPAGDSFWVSTIGVGEFSLLEVRPGSAPAVLSAFGLKIGNVYQGVSAYSQYSEFIPLSSFPNPRLNLDQLSIEAAKVRVFLGLGAGAGLRELSRTTSYLRRGGGGTHASITGSTALSTGGLYGIGGSLDGTSLSITFDGGAAVVVAMGVGAAAPLDASDLLDKINLATGGLYGSDTGAGLALTSRASGPASSVKLSGTAAGPLGLSTTIVNGVSGVQVVDDLNGDAVSPLLAFPGLDFTAAGTSAVTVGVVDLTTLTYPGDLSGKTLTLAVSGLRPQTYTFGAPGNAAAVLTALNAFWGPDVISTLDGSNHLVLTTSLAGEDATIDLLGGTALGALGLVPSLTGTIDLTTLLPDLTVLNGKKLKLNLGGTVVEHTFSALTNVSTITTVVAALNADVAFNALAIASAATGNKLRVRLLTGGLGVGIAAVPASSAEGAYFFGLDTSAPTTLFTRSTGRGLKPVSGDDLYVDGALVGRITAVAPGGVVNRLRVDKQLPINAAYGSLFYIVAKNIPAGSTTRPVPELVVDGFGAPLLKAHLIRDTSGVPVDTSKASVYLSYSAVRQDVTVRAKAPGLLRFDSTTQLDSILSPISTRGSLPSSRRQRI